MKDQQILERTQSKYHSFEHIQDQEPDDVPLGVSHDKTTVIHVLLEDRDDDDTFDGVVRQFSPGPWCGKTLTNRPDRQNYGLHENDGDKVGDPGVARSETGHWADANGYRCKGVHEEDSNRLGEGRMNHAVIPHVKEGEGSLSNFDQLFSPDKLAEGRQVGHDDQPQGSKTHEAAEATTRRNNIQLDNDNNNSSTNSTSKTKNDAILERMFTNLQSPRPRARRTGSLLHGILKVSSRTKVETTSEEEQAQAMELGQRWARYDKKTRRNVFANGSGHNSSGSPPSSFPLRNRATLGVMSPTYTLRDTLFYGIENMDISSAQYLEMRSRQDDDPVERLSSENAPCDQDLKGKQKGRSEHNELRDHREHIWAIAHEHEYGPASSGGGANSSPSDFEQGRYKRYSRLVPIPTEDSEQPVLLSTKGRSNAQIQAAGSGLREEVRPPRDGPDAYIPIIDSEPDADEDQRQPPSAPLPGPAPAPVSQGIYGPDSLAESLQGSTVGQSQQEQEHTKEDRRACLAKWKKWLFALMALLVVLVVVVLLLVLKKGGGGGGGGGNGGGEGGEEVYFEKGKDVHDEGTHGVTAKSTTSRSTPTATTKVATSTSTTIATTTAATEKLSSTFSAPGPTTTPTTGTTASTSSSSATTGI